MVRRSAAMASPRLRRPFRRIRALKSARTRHNVITRFVSVHRADGTTDAAAAGWEERLHVAWREAAYFDILIGESECGNPRGGVCNLIPAPPPRLPGSVSLLSRKSHGPSTTPVSTFPQTLFSVPYRAFPIRLIHVRPAPSFSLRVMREPLIYY